MIKLLLLEPESEQPNTSFSLLLWPIPPSTLSSSPAAILSVSTLFWAASVYFLSFRHWWRPRKIQAFCGFSLASPPAIDKDRIFLRLRWLRARESSCCGIRWWLRWDAAAAGQGFDLSSPARRNPSLKTTAASSLLRPPLPTGEPAASPRRPQATPLPPPSATYRRRGLKRRPPPRAAGESRAVRRPSGRRRRRRGGALWTGAWRWWRTRRTRSWTSATRCCTWSWRWRSMPGRTCATCSTVSSSSTRLGTTTWSSAPSPRFGAASSLLRPPPRCRPPPRPAVAGGEPHCQRIWVEILLPPGALTPPGGDRISNPLKIKDVNFVGTRGVPDRLLWACRF